MARIVYHDENYQTFYVDVNDQQPEVTIGRNQGNMIMIPTKSLSRYHAKIIYQNHRYFLLDLKSSNGSYVNSQRVTQQEIHPGDKIRLGDVSIEFIDDNRGMNGPSSAPMPPRPGQINVMPPQQKAVVPVQQKPMSAPKIQFNAGGMMPNMNVSGPDLRSVNMRPISGGGTYRPTMPNQPAFDDDMAKLAANQIASATGLPDPNAAPPTFNPMSSGFAPGAAMPAISAPQNKQPAQNGPAAMPSQMGMNGLPDPNAAPPTFNPMSSGFAPQINGSQMNPMMGHPSSQPKINPVSQGIGGNNLPDPNAAPPTFNPMSSGFAPSMPSGDFSAMRPMNSAPSMPSGDFSGMRPMNSAPAMPSANAAPQSFDPMSSGLVSQMPMPGPASMPSGIQPISPASSNDLSGAPMNLNSAPSGALMPNANAAPQSFDPMSSGLVSQMPVPGPAGKQSGVQPGLAASPSMPSGPQMNPVMPPSDANFDPMPSGFLPQVSVGMSLDSPALGADSPADAPNPAADSKSPDRAKDSGVDDIPPARRAASAAAFARRPTRANNAFNRTSVPSEVNHVISPAAQPASDSTQIPAPVHGRAPRAAAPRGRMPFAPKSSDNQEKSAVHEIGASSEDSLIGEDEVRDELASDRSGAVSIGESSVKSPEHASQAVSNDVALDPDESALASSSPAQPAASGAAADPHDRSDAAPALHAEHGVAASNAVSDAAPDAHDVQPAACGASHICQADLDAQADKVRAELTQEMDDLKTAHAKELDDLKAAHTAELDDLKAAHAKDLDDLKAAHTAELDDLKTAHAKELDGLKAAHTAELDDLKAAHTDEIAKLKDEQFDALSQLRAETDEAAEEMRKDYDALQSQFDKQQEELQALKDQLKNFEDVNNKVTEFVPLWTKRFEEMIDYAQTMEKAILKLKLSAVEPQAEEYVHSMADILRFCLDDLH